MRKKTQQRTDYYLKFIKTNANVYLKEYLTKDDRYWKTVGEEMALKLFSEMSDRVPAYKHFLEKHKINPKQVKTIADFKKVPVIDKENYINKYPLNELCWEGKIEDSYLLSASSGSTGIPNFWPRSTEQTYQGALISELIYKNFFQMDKKNTLYIVAFAMGTWIAGTYMMMSTEWVAQKRYPITVVTPGTNKEEILRLIRLGAKNYEQIILIGYPPFVKDVIDTGKTEGINWEKINIRFMFSGEAITEKWRTYLQKSTNIKNILTDTINIYGSADVGLIAHETVVTTYIRKKSVENEKIRNALFEAERIPAVYQFDPRLRYFERYEGHLLISARSGIPLCRYDTKDIGNILYFSEVEHLLGKSGIEITKDLISLNLRSLLWKLPLVYLFGRGKFTAIIYGANIYPEHVKLVLEHDELEALLTGKFLISTEEKADNSQILNLRIELRDKVNATKELKNRVKNLFITEISNVNSEYKNNLSFLKNKVHPIIFLHKYGDQKYFPRGIVKKHA